MLKGFFMSNHIFDYPLSPVEFSVYAYLCRCRSSKSGTCFPSFSKIAGACNISKRSVSNALNQLEELQLIQRENQFRERRQTSNLYTMLEVNPLPAPGANDACFPAQPMLSPGESAAWEVDKPNEINDTHQEGHSINGICERAEIENLPDEQLRETLRSVIGRMYAADFIMVDGTKIPQEQVRRQLVRLNSDVIDHALRTLPFGRQAERPAIRRHPLARGAAPVPVINRERKNGMKDRTFAFRISERDYRLLRDKAARGKPTILRIIVRKFIRRQSNVLIQKAMRFTHPLNFRANH